MSNQKKAVVIAAQPTGRTWVNGEGKTFHCHSLSFANGDTGEWLSASTSPLEKFPIGKECDYTIEVNSNPQYPAKIKPVYENKGGGNFGGGGRGGDPDTMLLSYCKDIAVARIANGFAEKINIASVLKDFVDLKAGFEASKTSAPVAAPAPVAQAAPQAQTAEQGMADAAEKDALPF